MQEDTRYGSKNPEVIGKIGNRLGGGLTGPSVYLNMSVMLPVGVVSLV